MSLSARRAWIEISRENWYRVPCEVALRKESVDRNQGPCFIGHRVRVALRKESVDRNPIDVMAVSTLPVALRKESVDRNSFNPQQWHLAQQSLSARRAWIEM